MTDIDDYCNEIETNADEILNNAETYSDEVVEQARDFRDAAAEIRSDARLANEKYSELRTKYDEATEEIENCYEALERMATMEELHEDTRDHISEEHEETREAIGSKGSYEGEDGGIFEGKQKGTTRDFLIGVTTLFSFGSLFGIGYLASQDGEEDTYTETVEFRGGKRYTMGDPHNFDSVVRNDSDFYDWLDQNDEGVEEVEELGVKTFSNPEGLTASVRMLEGFDEDNDLAILAERELGELDTDDINQERVGK